MAEVHSLLASRKISSHPYNDKKSLIGGKLVRMTYSAEGETILTNHKPEGGI